MAKPPKPNKHQVFKGDEGAPDNAVPPGKRAVEVIEVGMGAKLGNLFGSPFGGGLFGNSQQRAAGN